MRFKKKVTILMAIVPILIVCFVPAKLIGGERAGNHQIFKEMEIDSVKKLDLDRKTNTTDLNGKATIHKKRFGRIDIDSIKERISSTKLEKRNNNANLFLNKGVDSVLFQIETSKGLKINVIIDQVLDLNSPEYSAAKDSIRPGTQFVWCHINNDIINKFMITLSTHGIHGTIPVPNSKEELTIMPLGKNQHMVLEITPNATNPRWEGKE
jgi:hypothetical protein